jgi:hypothetical protein
LSSFNRLTWPSTCPDTVFDFMVKAEIQVYSLSDSGDAGVLS